MTLAPRSLAVVGVDHPNPGRSVGRRFEIAMCSVGEMVQLLPEPSNPADENAVAVYSARNVQIGYLTSERAAFIVRLLKRGEPVRAVFQGPTEWGAYVRVTFDGSPPVIPMQRDRDTIVEDGVDPEIDWHPDDCPD